MTHRAEATVILGASPTLAPRPLRVVAMPCPDFLNISGGILISIVLQNINNWLKPAELRNRYTTLEIADVFWNCNAFYCAIHPRFLLGVARICHRLSNHGR
jgi:hypothetical protein